MTVGISCANCAGGWKSVQECCRALLPEFQSLHRAAHPPRGVRAVVAGVVSSRHFTFRVSRIRALHGSPVAVSCECNSFTTAVFSGGSPFSPTKEECRMRYFALCLLLMMAWSVQFASAQSSPLWTTQVFSSSIGQLIFSADSTRIVVVSARRDSLAVVDATTGTVLWSRGSRERKYLSQVMLSPDGESIAILENDDGISSPQIVYVLATATGGFLNHTAPLNNIAQDALFDSMIFAPDSKGLYLAQRMNNPAGTWGGPPLVVGLIRLWDFVQGSYTDTIPIQNRDYNPWLGDYIQAVYRIQLFMPRDRPDTVIVLFNYFWEETGPYDPPVGIFIKGVGHDFMVYSFSQRQVIGHQALEGGRGHITNYRLLGRYTTSEPKTALITGSCEFSGDTIFYYSNHSDSRPMPDAYHVGVFDYVTNSIWTRRYLYPNKFARCLLGEYILLDDLNIWDYRRNTIVFQLPLSSKATSVCLPLPNANYLLLAGADTMSAGIYNIAERRWEETYGSTRATTAALSPTFRAFATGSSAGTVSLWQTKEWSSFPGPSVRAEFRITGTTGTTVAAHQPVTFANVSYPLSTNAQFFWDFGDGSELSGEFQPAHIFTRPGTYPVQLIVANADGNRDTAVKSVTVVEIPVTDIQLDAGLPVAAPIAVPNPAGDDGCRINFSLSRPSTVRIAIANVLGEEIAEPLPAVILQPGRHSFEWRTCRDGLSPAAGVYYALVQTEQKSFVVPIRVLK